MIYWLRRILMLVFVIGIFSLCVWGLWTTSKGGADDCLKSFVVPPPPVVAEVVKTSLGITGQIRESAIIIDLENGKVISGMVINGNPITANVCMTGNPASPTIEVLGE